MLHFQTTILLTYTSWHLQQHVINLLHAPLSINKFLPIVIVSYKSHQKLIHINTSEQYIHCRSLIIYYTIRAVYVLNKRQSMISLNIVKG